MDKESFRTYKLMEALSSGDDLTQRDLSRRLNISVGLVNAFLKRLARKGYMKVTTIPANRVRYLLTKKGFKEKTRLTLEYLSFSLDFYRNLKGMLAEIYRGFGDEGVKRVAFYKTGEVAELAYLHLRVTDLSFAGIFEEEPGRMQFFSHGVLPLSEAGDAGFDRIIVTSLEEIDKRRMELIDAGVDPKKILTLEP
jgi:DNA-binding MarR family transcriptional regulator